MAFTPALAFRPDRDQSLEKDPTPGWRDPTCCKETPFRLPVTDFLWVAQGDSRDDVCVRRQKRRGRLWHWLPGGLCRTKHQHQTVARSRRPTALVTTGQASVCANSGASSAILPWHTAYAT
jgi:hypothetical protein